MKPEEIKHELTIRKSQAVIGEISQFLYFAIINDIRVSEKLFSLSYEEAYSWAQNRSIWRETEDIRRAYELHRPGTPRNQRDIL